VGGDFWPEGIQNAPYNLVSAVNEALTVLSWHEKLPKDEVPPRYLWWSVDLIDKWFKDVERKRKRKSSGSTYDSADEVPMMGNEWTGDN
jgi:hypothetical protein